MSSLHSPASLQLVDIYYLSSVSKEVRQCSEKLFIATVFQKLVQVTRQVTGQQGSVLAVQILQLHTTVLAVLGGEQGCRTRTSLLLEISALRSASYVHTDS